MMDHLGLLLAAFGVEQRLERSSLTQNLVSSLAIGALILGGAIATMVLLAAALTFAIADQVGDWVSASLISAAVFAIVAAGLGLILRARFKKAGADLIGTPKRAPAPAGTDPGHLYALAENAGLTQPKTLWDIATLVALGFVSGLPHKAPPAG